MKNKFIKLISFIIFIVSICIILNLSISRSFATEALLGTEEDNDSNYYSISQEKYDFLQEKIENYDNTASSVSTGKYNDYEIDLITNVVMHEVGELYGGNVNVIVTYANGTSVDYNGTNIIHKIHAQVLINQYNSSIFPESLSTCISWYWDAGLVNQYYYNHYNTTWQACRTDVVEVINSAPTIPSNVFAATCDPYFALYYPGYSLYAAVYWSTGWYSGTFYYYQYNN